MNSNSLLIKPIPYPDESAGSLLIRAAEKNGFSSVFVLCQSQITSYSKSLDSSVTHQKKFGKLLKLLGLSNDYTSLAFELQGSTQAMPRTYGKIYIEYSLFRKDCRAFCPICLKEKSYWRRHWLLRPYTVCLKHHIILYDCCPSCQNELRIGRNKIHICNHCRQDLRLVTCKKADAKATQWFMTLINNNCQQFFDRFSDYWIALEKSDWCSNSIETDYHRIQMAYEYFTDYEQSKKTLSHIINAKIPQIHPEIQVVYFRRQNKELNKYIDSVLPLCRTVTVSAPKHYEQYFKIADVCAILQISNFRLYNLLDKRIIPVKRSKFTLISSKHIEQVLLSGVHKDHLKTQRDISPHNTDLLDIAEIAVRLHVHQEVIRNLNRTGWLRMGKKKVGSYIKTLTTESDLEIFNKNYILVGTLAYKLGVNSTNLAEKLRHYGINPIGGPHIDGLKTTLFNKDDIAHITTKMITSLEYYHTFTGRSSKNRSKQDYYKSDSKLYVSLKQAAQKLLISPSRIAVLVHNNILRKDEHSHNAVMVEKASIYALLKELHRTDFISLPEAAKELDCAINWLHINWIKTSYVKLYDYMYWQFVSIKDINKVKVIQKEYMTAIEASKLLGMHRTHIINLKAQGKINSVSFGESNSLNLYRREDILALLKQQNDGDNPI